MYTLTRDGRNGPCVLKNGSPVGQVIQWRWSGDECTINTVQNNVTLTPDNCDINSAKAFLQSLITGQS
jgi:hypothetical protein